MSAPAVLKIVDRHAAQKGQQVWAMVKGVPVKITFQGLAPYCGFYHGPEWSSREECIEEAIFAETRNDLLWYHASKLEEGIALLRTEMDRLIALKNEPEDDE